jgi:hypothetical protein
VDFIEADVLGEDGDDEGDRRDEPVPEAPPEARDLPSAPGVFSASFGPGAQLDRKMTRKRIMAKTESVFISPSSFSCLILAEKGAAAKTRSPPSLYFVRRTG